MKIISRSVKDTIRVGRLIARNLKGADVICLFGQLGSGKTTLAKGLGLGLGIRGEDITSPSFVLIRRNFKGRLPLYHFDLFRLNEPKDILNLGYEEYLYDDGITVIEWAERLQNLLPREFLKIELSIKGRGARLIKLSALGLRYHSLLNRINEDIGS